MNKLLYITANSKPEELSCSKKVGRALINDILTKFPDFSLEELDLYNSHIPRPKYNYFNGRSSLVSPENTAGLSQEEQQDIIRMTQLCDQFISASIYVLAAPMWSLSFPGVLKDYIDCIIQADKTIVFKDEKPSGILNDRPRTFIYVQSSGANIPWIIKPVLNKGVNYVEDIMKFIGIGKFEDLLVDYTGTTELDQAEAVDKALTSIDSIIDSIEV